jgi:hypothetical protein
MDFQDGIAIVTSKAEIDQMDISSTLTTGSSEQKVIGFDITVDYASRMHIFEYVEL